MPGLDAVAQALREAQADALGTLDAAGEAARTRATERHTRIRADHERAVAVARNRSAQTVIQHTLIARDSLAPRTTDPDPLAVAERVRLGSLRIAGSGAGVNTDIDVPLLVPLIGRSNLVVSGRHREELTREAIWQALDTTAAGQLDVIGFDPLLTGALAPFAPLRTIDSDLLVVHSRGSELETALSRLVADVQRVTDTLRGADGSLVDFRTRVGHPIERFRLVALLDYPHGVDEALHRQVLALAKAGPSAGVSFLFHLGEAQARPDWWRASELEGLGTTLADRDGTLSWPAHPAFAVHPTQRDTASLAREVDALTRRAAAFAAPAVPFESVQQTQEAWTESSRSGLTFAIGRSGSDTTLLTLGDEREQRHNILVTGAVGQGKSNLLKVIVHSLAQRYSPDELEMYLLDFKEGVTLYPFAPTPEDPRFLPHARVLGLESDREFGLAVLRRLEAEFARRAKLFRPHGDDISKYRAAVPGARMPRILLVVDEFHLLFDPADQTAEAAAQLLETLARKGRSYGVHIVLASQTVSGIAALLTRENGIFAQFPIRLALKNNVAESYATLTQGNDAAARLRARGEAVLNLDYGFPAANQTTVIAAAADATLDVLRSSWWERVRDRVTPPMVFDGSLRVRPAAAIPALRQLRLRAVQQSAEPAAVIGLPISVETAPLTVGFPARPGRHLAILGAGDAAGEDEALNTAIGVLQTAAISLALQHPMGDAEFIMLDCLDERTAERNNQGHWLGLMESLGFPVETVHRSEVATRLGSIAQELSESEPLSSRRYILGFGLERADLDQPDAFAHRAAEDLQTLLRSGPSRGTHLLGWWANAAAFRSHIGFDGDGYIEALLLLRVDQSTTHDLLGPFVTWSVRENRGLLTDRTQLAEPTVVIPFSPIEPRDRSALSHVDWS